MTQYSSFSDSELIEVLQLLDSLSHVAKEQLLKEIQSRKNQEIRSFISDLSKIISEEKENIQSLTYIKNLGFDVTSIDQSNYTITRSGRAILIDVIAIVLGTILSVLGIFGVIFLLSFSSPINGIVLSVFGYIGIKMLINGINRIFDYFGFMLQIENKNFTFKRKFDLPSGELKDKIQSLKISKSEDQISLVYKDTEIIKVGAPNAINSSTLEAIISLN
ncbi:hypothetical protein [Aquimarina spongiae]|uniref:Uncharacterized protein n=1 Tax=Aquimarina spongiae TaxID=570521 RepID=A0A1M6LBM5_9FLAO|nr:hypothetical protein [Aquimarina spongiae]SHJ68611.1 hypothetical protein SAMN04488508_11516 [Aquimarina spongiae]